MKGIEVFASLVAILFLIGISSMLAGVAIMTLNLVSQPSTAPINYEMRLSYLYPPIKYETMLLSYLEVTDTSGFQIKKILMYAAYQNNIEDVFIDGKDVTTLKSTTSDIFTKWIPSNPYLISLNVKGKSYVIADKIRSSQTAQINALKLRKISLPVYIESKIADDLKYNKDQGITLDFYVQ
jgi:hypothetical protein